MYIYNVCIQAHMLLPAKIPYFHSNIREFEKKSEILKKLTTVT